MSRPKKKLTPTLPADFTLDTDKVFPVPVFAEEVLGVSTDTFERICKAGDGPPITWLSANRKGVRGRDGKTWLESRRAKPALDPDRGQAAARAKAAS